MWLTDNSVKNWRNKPISNPQLDLHSINAHPSLVKIHWSYHPETTMDGWTDRWMNRQSTKVKPKYPTIIVWWGIKTRGPRWPCIAHLITRQVWVSWPFGSTEVQYWFSRQRSSWISIQNDLSYFWSTSHLDTSNEVWVNCPFQEKKFKIDFQHDC